MAHVAVEYKSLLNLLTSCDGLLQPNVAAAAAAAAPALEAPAVDYKHSLLASREDYDKMYKRSIEDPAAFWGDIAKGYHWESQVDIFCRASQSLVQLICLIKH